MKDSQSDLSGQQAHIPVISPILHWVAMPALVCLRSGFGYLYLRPKSIFLSFSLAFTLLFIVAWNEPDIWATFALPVSFAFVASILYVTHLVIAVREQVADDAEHDTYSGRSHLLRAASIFRIEPSDRLEMHAHVWIEPLIVLIAAGFVRLADQHLMSDWLALIALCLVAKEARNYWSEIRKRKRKADLHSDTEDDAEDHLEKPVQGPPKGTRKPKRKHTRSDG
jgi:hypothetical protein